jgi:diguanylate cyclase (GGDEF)-like protein
MNGSNGVSAIEGIQKALQVLGVLKGMPAGYMIYRQVEEILQNLEASFAQIERTYGSLLYALLDAYLAHLSPGSPIYIQVKLLQRRLQPPLLASELEVMKTQIDLYADHIAQMQVLDLERFTKILAPLLENLPIPNQSSGQQSPAETEDHVDTSQQVTASQQQFIQPAYVETSSQPGDMEAMRSRLASEVETSITENQKFGVILDVVADGLKQAESIDDIVRLRSKLLPQIQYLHEAYHGLSEKLHTTYKHMSELESEQKRIDDDLTKARMLCMLDEITELPNRRAFLQKVEDEVGRVQRHSLPLSLAIIDLDGFNVVTEQYGQETGNKVLRGYAKDVFSLFRKYDTVSRYGNGQFAMLLPNTDKNGAVAALSKAKEKVSGEKSQLGSAEFQIPPFKAGLTVYQNGDSVNSFIERADHALYRARSRDADWLEFDKN